MTYTYRVEFDVSTDYDDLTYDNNIPTKEEILDLLYCFINDLDKGYLEPDIRIFRQDENDNEEEINFNDLEE